MEQSTCFFLFFLPVIATYNSSYSQNITNTTTPPIPTSISTKSSTLSATSCICPPSSNATDSTQSPVPDQQGIKLQDAIFYIFIPTTGVSVLIILVLTLVIIRLCYNEALLKRKTKLPSPTIGSPLDDNYGFGVNDPNNSEDMMSKTYPKQNRNSDESQQFSKTVDMERFLGRSNIGTYSISGPGTQIKPKRTIISRMKQVASKTAANIANSTSDSMSDNSFKQQLRTDKRKLSDDPVSVTVK